MSLVFNETFQLRAPAEQVWRFLLDPTRVVECMPGAALLGIDDVSTFRGRVSAKVGPITSSYAGRASFDQVDETKRRVVIIAEGKEGTGSGSAKMILTGEVFVLDADTSEVRLSA